jgi:hypothetical protein
MTTRLDATATVPRRPRANPEIYGPAPNDDLYRIDGHADRDDVVAFPALRTWQTPSWARIACG